MFLMQGTAEIVFSWKTGEFCKKLKTQVIQANAVAHLAIRAAEGARTQSKVIKALVCQATGEKRSLSSYILSMPAPLVFARYSISISIHLYTGTVSEKKHRLLTGSHL